MDVNDQVMLVRASLYESILVGDWHNISFFRFLNRAAYNLRAPFTFLVCQLSEKKSTFRIVNEDPPPDPMFMDQLRAALSARSPKSAPKRRVTKAWDDCLIPFLNDSTYFRLLVLKNNYQWPRSPNQPLSLSYTPVSRNSRIGKYLEAVFSDFGSVLGEEIGSKAHVIRMLNHSVDTYDSEGQHKLVRAANSAPESRIWSACPLAEEQRKKAWSDHVLLLDTDYLDTLRGSPLLAPHGRQPANIVFFSKVFDRTSTRYGAYHYTCQAIIPPAQRQDILTAFERMADLADQRSGKTFKYRPFYIGNEGTVGLTETKWRYASGDPAYHEEDHLFWSKIMSTRGRRELLDLLESPLPDTIRLFADTVLTSSVSEAIDEPLKYPRLGSLNRDATRNDRLRLATWHYVLAVMAVDRADEPEHHSILTLPFRISGSTILAAAFLRSHAYPNDGKNAVDQSLLDTGDFRINYLTYKALMVPLERHYRRRTKENYIDHIADICCNTLAANHVAENLYVDERTIRELNRLMRELSIYYSYPLIVMEQPKSARESVFFASNVPINIVPRSRDNPCFDATVQETFLSAEELKNRIFDATLAAIARLNVSGGSNGPRH